MKQEPAEIAVSPPLGGDELRCRLEDLVAELSVRGVQKTSASRTRNSGERIQGGSLQGETERRAKMAEAVIGRSATRAGDQCVISVDSEDGAAAEASRRVKQEATSQWGGSGAEHRALSVHAEKIVQEEVTSSRCAGATSELDQNKGACINKPTYDGKADWRMFLIQFELMAKLEGWTDKEKTVGIITSLTGDALPYLRFIDVAHGDSYESVLAQLSDCFVGIQVARPRDGPRADHGSGSRASVSDRMPGAGRSMVKAGRYDGTSPWEAYQAKFKMAALNNAWSPTEKAGQLAAALDGKALQVLLDLGPDELESYDVIATALDRRFGRVEPAVGLRQRLATRIRGPGEKLGVLAADVLYLARRGYPDYPPATQGDLAMEAFVRGLTPNALRQQVRLAAPTSLELALAHAERVEAVLEEGERDWAPGGNQREGREWTDRPRPTARQAQAEEEETADSHAAPPWISDLAALIRTVSTQAPHTRLCWNCGKPGHLQRRCPSAAAPPNCSSSEKHQGARVSGTTWAPHPVSHTYHRPPAPHTAGARPPSGERVPPHSPEATDSNPHRPAVVVGRTTAGDFCHVPVQIEGVPCTALVDTGSTVTLVRPDVLPEGIRLEPTTVQLRTVTGELTPMKGRGNLAIEVAGRTVHHPVWVAAVQDPCILGLDFLRYTGGQLDLRTGTLHLQGGPALALANPEGRAFSPGQLGRDRDPFARQGQTAKRGELMSQPYPLLHRHGPRQPTLGRGPSALSRTPPRQRVLTPSPTPAPRGNAAFRRAQRRRGLPLPQPSMPAQGTSALSWAPRRQGRRPSFSKPPSVAKTTASAPTSSAPPPGTMEDPTVATVTAVWRQNCEGLHPEQQAQLWELLLTYRHSFATNPEDVGRTHMVQHSIDTGEARPIKLRPRRQPLARQEATEEALKEMREAGIIEPSDSPWTSPVVMVPKKDGKWRFCVDYRRLNDVTEKDSYPLPRIDESLDLVAGSKWFSSLDLRSGYWQVALSPAARPKTAFSTGRGLWQFTVMPFGLCNAPATFERLMEKVLVGLPPTECLVYLDDLLVHGKTFQAALASLREVLRRVTEAGLKLHPEKCQFLRKEVTFLGHRVGEDGISTEPCKVTAVRDWPTPINLRQLRGFLGLASYYRRFVQGFATIAAPLHCLLRKGEPFEWTQERREAFDSLKMALCQSPVLAPPDPHSTFLLDTDASDEGIGAVLSQPGSDGEQVVAYYSRSLSKTERRYCVTRRELLAVVESVRHFRHYLCGLPFTVRTDHAALQWLLTFREPEGQVARWIEQLQAFNYSIQHRAGEKHANADALSRRPCAQEGCAHCDRREQKEAELSSGSTEQCCTLVPVERTEWRRHQEADPDLCPVLQWLEDQWRPPWEEVARYSTATRGLWSQWTGLGLKDGVLQRQWKEPATGEVRWQVVVPQALRLEVLKAHHGTPGTGHFGVTKTLRRLRQSFYWGQCRRDVEDHCRRCDTCTARKGPPGRSHAPLQQYQVGGPMERVAVDVLGPFPRSEKGNRFVLVALDYFTKWPEAYALPDQEAETVAEALLEGFFSRFGIPQELHSDQGRNFESRVFAEMCRRMGIQKTRTTPLHPQSDGLVERFNRTLAVQLAVTTASHQKDWDTQLPLVLLACRSAVQDSTACTPALLMLGRELRTPAEMIFGRPSDTPSVPPGPEYARRLQDRLEVAHHFAREQLQAAGVRQKRNYDLRARGRHFIAGELVWIFSPKRKRGRCPKLDSHWLGPCQVLERIGEVVYRVQLPPRGRKVVLHRDRLAPYLGRNPAQTDTVTPDSPLLPPADSPCPASPSPSTPVPDSPLPGSSTPLDSVSPSAVADGGSTPVRPRPQRHRRLPGRFRDFALPRGRGTKGGAV